MKVPKKINKLKEERISEENEARRRLNKIHKNKIEEVERDRFNRLEEAKRIIMKTRKKSRGKFVSSGGITRGQFRIRVLDAAKRLMRSD